ncbi:hypothetical protein ACF1GT_02225 [Streptomyces sp. NPDC014636]|uniref:hypothetical protein n=1 Tax=Streptomyces sp. NPDC014636 TaxID=3364876 RepID=UPI0036FD516C
MRTPHIPTHQAVQSDAPTPKPVPPTPSPYDELASLADDPPEDFLTEDSSPGPRVCGA